MKKIRKLWKKWEKMVEEHNKSISTYETMEEVWSPTTIFLPLVAAVASCVIFTLLSLVAFKPQALICLPYIFIGVLLLTGLYLFIHWKAYSE